MGNKTNQGKKDENKSEKFKEWVAENNRADAINIWREIMLELRNRGNDTWKSARYFLTLNGVIIAVIIKLLQDNNDKTALFLIVLGLFFYYFEYNRFVIHRGYFVEVLMRKTLIEDALNFYNLELHSQVNLASEWQVSNEELGSLKKNPVQWKDDHSFRKKTASHYMRYNYWLVCVVFVILLIYTLFSLSFDVIFAKLCRCLDIFPF